MRSTATTLILFFGFSVGKVRYEGIRHTGGYSWRPFPWLAQGLVLSLVESEPANAEGN